MADVSNRPLMQAAWEYSETVEKSLYTFNGNYLCFQTQRQVFIVFTPRLQSRENWFCTALVISSHYEIPAASPKTKAAVVLMQGSGAQMFDSLPGRGAKPGLSPDTERLPCAEEGGKIAFHGFRQIIEFKSPVYNSSWSQRILSIYLRSHFPFFSGWQWQITISLPDFYSA